jgi:hypothetical protein
MDATDRAAALRAWGLATFHAASFLIAAATALHLAGSLPDFLGRLDTVSGLSFFLFLWAITTLTTRRGLRGIGPALERPATPVIAEAAVVAAGWNGAGVFLMLVALGLGSTILHGTVNRGIAPAVFGFVVLGSLVAFTAGAIVGAVYGLTDALLLSIGAFLWRRAGGGAPNGSG